MEKLFIDYTEFYITHVCNLSCNGCNRFNNRKLKGWQKWEDYESVYQEWGKQLNIGRVSIMGGETLLNSSIYDWIQGITTIWPNAPLIVLTNGFFLPQHKKLYDYLLSNKRINLKVGIHNKLHKKRIVGYVEDFLKGKLSYKFDNTPYRWNLTITDSNGIKVLIEYNWWFHQGAIIKEDGYETLHNSDPIKAHKNCHSKECHHFDKGRLYKCGPAALFPQYDKQMPLTLSPTDRQLMESINSIGVDDPYETKKLFLENIKDPIPQCKFCPEVYQGEEIFAKEKKDIIISV